MSKQNKFFAAATTAALVASAIVPVASAAEFKDANQIAPWAAEAVQTLAAKDIIGGNPDGSFNPKGNVTRAEAAKMFKVALDLPVQGTESFTDVKDGQWFQDVIIAVSNAGIVDGMGNGLFAPNGKLTRAEAAKMIVKAYGFEGEADLSKFADADKVAGKWFEAPLSTAVAAGIIAGKGNLLAANDSITRQEFAVMLTRAIDTAQEANAEELLAAVEKATTALDTAVKALNTEVKAEEVDAAKAEVKTAKEALTALETAVADAKDVISTEASAKATAAIEAAKKAIETTEAAIELTLANPQVLAVQAINATQVEVKFNKAVKKSTVITGTDTLANVAFTSLEATPKEITEANAKAVLSEDGKTLTITAGLNGTSVQEVFEGRYQVVINNVEDATSVKVTKFDEVLNLGKDTAAPTIKSTEKVNATTTKVNFSEPIANVGNFSFKLADGTIVPVVTSGNGANVSTLSDDKKSLTIQIVGTAYTGKTVTATVIGTQDVAGNLLSPNPATFDIQVGSKDGVAPTVTSLTATNDKEVVVTFSEEVQGFDGTQLAISGTGIATTLPAVTVKQDNTDKKKYTLTYASSILTTGTTTAVADASVAVTGISDLSGEDMTAVYNKILTVKKDTVAPELVSSSVITEAGVKYLVLNFNEAVTTPAVDSATSVKNYVTTNGAFVAGTTTLSTDAKTVKIALESTTAINGSTFAGAALVEGTNYTVKFNVTDTSSNTTATPVAATFTYTGTVSSDKPVVSNASALTGQSTVAVTFDREVDGATATNVANYTIAGVTVKSATLAPVSGTTQTVTLTLDSNELNGNRAITVANVKSKAGVAMDTFTGVVGLTENIKPEVKSAKVTGTKTIEVTFSEAITGFADADDFVIKAGATTVAYGNTVNTLSADGTKVTITLNTALDAAQLAETITLETLVGGTSPIVDAAANQVKTGTVTVSK